MLLLTTVLCAILLYQAQGFIYKKMWNKNLDIRISYEKDNCTEGEINTLTEIITNNKLIPIPILHVKFNTPKSFLFKHEENSSVTDYYYRDDIFSIMGHQIITRRLPFVCSKRGCYSLNDTNIVSGDLFLQKTFHSKIKNTCILHVYPAKIDISQFQVPFNTITGNIATMKTLIEDPFEFRGIREYMPYDSMQNINWKASARTGNLHVNTYHMTSSQEVYIFLNLETHIYTKNEKIIENSIRIASSLSLNFINLGIPVGLETNGTDKFTRKRVYNESGRGIEHMTSIDRSLSRIDTDSEPDNFIYVIKNAMKKPNKNSYYIFISNNRHKELLDYYGHLKTLQLSCYLIVPEYASSPVSEEAKDMIKWNVY